MQYAIMVLQLAAANGPQRTSAALEYFEWRHELQRSAPADYRRSRSRESWNAELYALRTSLTSKVGPFSLWQLFASKEGGVENLFYFEMLYERSRSIGVDVTPIGKAIPIILFVRNFDTIVRRKKVETVSRAGIESFGQFSHTWGMVLASLPHSRCCGNARMGFLPFPNE